MVEIKYHNIHKNTPLPICPLSALVFMSKYDQILCFSIPVHSPVELTAAFVPAFPQNSSLYFHRLARLVQYYCTQTENGYVQRRRENKTGN